MIRLFLLFLHVASAMGIVAGLAIEGLGMVQLRAACTSEEARKALTIMRYVQRVAGPSFVATLVTGLYLATAYWGWRGAWMGVAMLAIVAMALVGGFMTVRATTSAMRGPSDALDAGAISALQARLGMSYTIRLGLFVGIVFLMTIKPASGPIALGAVLVGGALGFFGGAARTRGSSRRPRLTSNVAA